MGNPFKRVCVMMLSLGLILQTLAIGSADTVRADQVAAQTGTAYQSTIPTPQETGWINSNYNRDYDNHVVTSAAGFVHPGFVQSREDLTVMRDMIWQGFSPWKESFEIFRESAFSKMSYIMSGPFTNLASDRETYALIRDGQAAHQLSLMWIITGDDAYAEKAKSILNSWAETLASDTKRDLIRNGGAAPPWVSAAEILRYTPNSGWGNEKELSNFERMLRVLIPAIDLSTGYYNQGNFATEGLMAIAVYLDDKQLYEKAVERVVHNSAQVGTGLRYNHSLNSMILASGQQVEMGRDIPHAQDSMRPWAAMARTTYIQDTKVNELGQIVSTENGGRNLFEVYDQKLLKYAAYFSKYNLGSDVIWQPSITGTGHQAAFDKITTDQRGRMDPKYGILINYYKHEMDYTNEVVRDDPYMNDDDGIYTELYGDNTYGGLFKYIDAAYEQSGTYGLDEMMTTPWTVSIGQTGTGVPAAPTPPNDAYELWNRLPGYAYTATGGTEGGVVTEPFEDEDDVVRFATSNVKNGAWTAYTVDFDQFGSTPGQLANMLTISFAMNSNIGGSIDVRVGPFVEKPSVTDFNASLLAGTIQTINTTWYNIFKTNAAKLTDRPDLLTGKKTVYFRFYGSGNGYNFHGNTMWFKFSNATIAAEMKAGNADMSSSGTAVTNADHSVTLTNGGYIGFKNTDFDKGIGTFNIGAKTNGGTLKLALGNPDAAPFKTYELTDTGDLMRTFSFEHGDNEQLYGRNGGHNDLFLVYEGAGSVTIDSFVAVPVVNNTTFEAVNGGNYVYNLAGNAERTNGNDGSVRLHLAPGAATTVSYSKVDFKTGSPTMRIKVKSDTDAKLRFDLLNNPVGTVAEYSIPKTDGLGENDWITLNLDLSKTGYSVHQGGNNALRVTATSESGGIVELQDFLFGESGAYPSLQAESNTPHILLYPGASYVNTIKALDAFGNPVNVAAITMPETATFDSATGHLGWNVPSGEPAGNGYMTLAATGNDGISTSVFMVQYTILELVDYIDRLIAEARQLIPLAEALAEDDYTSDNWILITNALNASKAIVEQTAPSREDAETAYYDLKHALDAVPAIPEADIFGKSYNVTLNNGNTGQTAKNIISVWFDDRQATWTEWQGSNQWAVFDLGPGKKIKLDRVKILGRPQWGSRINGTRVEGSNNGNTWTRLTNNAANTDAWQKFFSLDSESAYRYIRVSNTGGWYANLSEIKFYGTFVDLELRRDISHVSLTTSNANPTAAEVGDKVTLNFTADRVIEEVNVLLHGKSIVPVSNDGLHWTAEFEYGQFDTTGTVNFIIDYKNGWPVEATTDGSSVTLLEEPGYIGNVLQIAGFIDSTPNRTEEQTLTQVAYLFDRNILTSSDFRGPNNNGVGWFIMDFKQQTIQLTKVKLIARQDQLARTAGTVIEGSNDLSDWTTLVSDVQGIANWQAFEVANDSSFQYLRVRNPGNWFGNLGELKLYGELSAPLNVAKLQAALATAEQIDQSLYSADTVAELNAAIAAAQEVLETTEVTQSFVNAATARLEAAIQALVRIQPVAILSGTDEAVPGDNVQVSVGVELGGASFTALEAVVQYDPAKLEFQLENRALAAEAIQSVREGLEILGTAVKPEMGEIMIIMAGTSTVTEDGELFKLNGKVRDGTVPGHAMISLSSFGLSLAGQAIELATEGVQHVITIVAADMKALTEAINNAQALHNAVLEGTSAGQYPYGSKSVLQASINTAKDVKSNEGATQTQIDAALTALNQAVTSFRNSVIVAQPGDKSELIASIQEAKRLHDKATEGTKVGQYATGSKTALKNAIQAAEAVRTQSGVSQSAINQAVAILREAMQTFTTQFVSLIPGATKITVRDLSVMVNYYGVENGNEGWSDIEAADVLNKGRIDIQTLAAVARMILTDWLES